MDVSHGTKRQFLSVEANFMRRFLAVAVLATVGLFTASAAPILFAVSGSGNAASNLYTVNLTTGATTLVGATGFDHITGLAFNPVTGVLYGHVSNIFGSPSATNLVTIDRTTGAATLVGSTDNQIPDMTFNASGVLFAWSECSTASCSNTDDLYTINTSTGAATFVGESGIGTSNTGLAFSPSGDLYLKSGADVHILDPLSGLSLLAGPTLNRSTNNALAFSPGGTAYSIIRASGTTTLVSIDLGTGIVTDIGDMGIGTIAALAFVDDSAAVPEPSALILQLTGLTGLVMFGRRRLRKS